jgi:cytosine/uracil/thiamine/allantoin permease
MIIDHEVTKYFFSFWSRNIYLLMPTTVSRCFTLSLCFIKGNTSVTPSDSSIMPPSLLICKANSLGLLIATTCSEIRRNFVKTANQIIKTQFMKINMVSQRQEQNIAF